MPRIYTSANDALDYCRKCMPSETAAKLLFDNLGDGPDERGNCFGWMAEHPDYQGDGYSCVHCHVELTEEDN